MVKFSTGDPIEQKILSQLDNPNLHQRIRHYVNFAVGNDYDDRGDYNRAFMHYTKGNHEAKKFFDSLKFRQQIKDTICVYGKT